MCLILFWQFLSTKLLMKHYKNQPIIFIRAPQNRWGFLLKYIFIVPTVKPNTTPQYSLLHSAEASSIVIIRGVRHCGYEAIFHSVSCSTATFSRVHHLIDEITLSFGLCRLNDTPAWLV